MTTPSSSPSYYWFYQGDYSVLVVAVGFGLGPRVAAENLLLDLKIIEDWEIEWHKQGLAEMTGLIEVRLLLNFGVTSALPDFRPEKRVWIDCVDWLRTTLPPHIKDYDLLLREAFFPSARSADKGDTAKWHDVQPLIRPPRRDAHPDANLILLSFGGVATPHSTDVHMIEMPLVFLRGVKQYLDALSGKRVIAFLPRNLLERCTGKEVTHERLELRELDRVAFGEAMKCCGMLICQPGLYTPFEAMKMGVPFALTYPMSFTQDRQAAKFRDDMKVECCECGWATHDETSATPLNDIETIEKGWFANSAKSWNKKLIAKLSNKVKLWLMGLGEGNRLPYQGSHRKTAKTVVKNILPSFPSHEQEGLFDLKSPPNDDIQPEICSVSGRARLEPIINELKRCVTNGLFQQATELTDQLMAFHHVELTKPANIDLLVAIKVERLKRLDYLGFDEGVRKSGEELLKIFDANRGVLKDKLGESDFAATQFVAIGQPLWNEGKSRLQANIKKCERLLSGFSFTDKHLLVCHAFLYGLKGRLEQLNGNWEEKGISLFNQGRRIFTCLPKKTQGGYPHLLAYFIENALEADDTKTAAKFIEKFYRSTLPKSRPKFKAKPSGGHTITPIKMHIRLRVQLAEYKHSIVTRKPKATQNKYARECWLTAYFLGLNVRTPLPPLLKDLAVFSRNQSRGDDTRLAHNILIEMFNDTDWRCIEQIVALYFEAEGYEVERLFAGAMSFDLIVRQRGLHGEVTATGVQVKHWKEPIGVRDFDEFVKKLYRTPAFEKLTHVLIYCTNNNIHDSVRAAAKHACDRHSNLQSIEFIGANKLASGLLQSPSVLPAALYYAGKSQSASNKNQNKKIEP